MNMKRFLYSILLLSIVACSGNKPQGVDVAGITPSPFVGYWVNVGVNDTVQNISLRIGERNDSLLVSFYWEREEPFYMTGNPMIDTAGEVIPQACIAVPKNGNKAAGNIVNQYFSVFQNYPRNEYYPLCLELKSLDTLTFKIDGNVNYWPDSAILVRKSSENSVFSTKVVELYKEHYNIPDTEVTGTNKFDISGIEPSPFIGRWEWTENGPWQNFYVYVAERNDSLLIAPGGVFLGGVFQTVGFVGAPGQVHPGVGVQGVLLHVLHQGAHTEADGTGNAGSLGEPAVIVDGGVNGHQAAHAGAADGGTLPEGDGGVVPVDEGLDLLYDPLHGFMAHGEEFAEMAGLIGGIGQVLAEPLLALVAALDAHHDHVFFPVLQKILQSPGFAVGGILIGEQVMPVKEVHDGIAFAGGFPVLRQPDVQGAVGIFWGVDEVALDDHVVSSKFRLSRMPKRAAP